MRDIEKNCFLNFSMRTRAWEIKYSHKTNIVIFLLEKFVPIYFAVSLEMW